MIEAEDAICAEGDSPDKGVFLARAYWIYAYLLAAWSQDRGFECLNAFQFDKFVVFVTNLWNVGCQADRVSFRIPMELHPGAHGYGYRDKAEGGGSAGYIGTQVFHDMKCLAEPRLLFKIDAPDGPQRLTTLFRPGVPHGVGEQRLRSCLAESEDMGFVRAVRGALAELTPDQVRVLGTHWTCPQTQAAVNYEFTRWRDFLAAFAAEYGDALQRGPTSLSSFVRFLKAGCMYSLEACRKSAMEHNGRVYMEAHRGLRHLVGSSAALKRVAWFYEDADSIWRNNDVMAAYEDSGTAEDISSYLTTMTDRGFRTVYETSVDAVDDKFRRVRQCDVDAVAERVNSMCNAPGLIPTWEEFSELSLEQDDARIDLRRRLLAVPDVFSSLAKTPRLYRDVEVTPGY